MVKTTHLSLYVINRVIYRSYVIGLLQESLSGILGKSSSYVNNIRSEKNDAVFAPDDYAQLARTLNWEVHDLLPPKDSDYSDGILVDKIVFTLSNPQNAKDVLIGLIRNNYFNAGKTLENIYTHLYLIKNSADPVKRQVIKDVLDEFVSDNLLQLNDDKYFV